MAQVTFTIPDNKINFFVDCFGEDYQEKIDKGIIDGGITKNQYAKDEALKYMAQKVKVWHRQNNQPQSLDITND